MAAPSAGLEIIRGLEFKVISAASTLPLVIIIEVEYSRDFQELGHKDAKA